MAQEVLNMKKVWNEPMMEIIDIIDTKGSSDDSSDSGSYSDSGVFYSGKTEDSYSYSDSESSSDSGE